MEVAHGPLARAFTSPAPSHSRLPNSNGSSIGHNQGHPFSQYSNFSQPSHRSSDSTQDTSASTLFSQVPAPTSTPPNGGPVGATNNVINRVAEKETSLFQICVTLRNRLKGVPGFEQYFRDVEDLAEEEEEDAIDPVTLLWRTFRRGFPLITIFNALQPKVLLEFPEQTRSEAKREKEATFKFLQGCMRELEFPNEDVFMINDLYGDDTSGFVKVVKVVNRVVDLLVQKGLLASTDKQNDGTIDGQNDDPFPLVKRTQRQHIVDELVRTERTYVQHLELLQSFKKFVEQRGVIAGDAIHDIFLNLDSLLDFQRRFLIRVEQTNALPEEKQNWGQHFKLYAEAFQVYEPYIANQKKCEETAMRDFDKLREAGGPIELQQIVESPTLLTAYLLKPFQRLSKYPLLLKELRDKGDLDEGRRQDISEAINAVSAVLERTNAYIDREERLEAVQALKSQVEDWRNHRVEAFGELLLHGTHTVIKGDAMGSEREYRMYLFEKILLCCKELGPKQMAKMKYKTAASVNRNGMPRMALKGRIFMQNVTETIAISKPGSYSCQIYWRGDDCIEFFSVRFATEDVSKRWMSQIEQQRKICQEQARRTTGFSTSETEFNYIRDQGVLENPYAEEDYGEVDDAERARLGYSDYSHLPLSRNASSTSLRSRSTTGDSGPPLPQTTARAPTSRYPAGFTGAPLTLRTQHLPNGTVSPGDRGGNSYFSPTLESPLSSRTSSSSGILSFPRQATPQNGWHGEDSVRYTAPAYMRPPMRDATNGHYQMDPRTGRVLPNPAPPSHPASLSQTRNRSASSPDIHVANNRRVVANAPPLPNVPSHLARNAAVVNRSQNNSPIYGNGAALTTTHSQDTYQAHRGYDGVYKPMRSDSGMVSPPPITSMSSMNGSASPTQLRVKVKVPSEGSSFVLVVPFHIAYQALKDRIDAKLQRHTNLSLANGTVKLKYLYDDVFVTIQTDEDVQTAFETWKDQQQEVAIPGQQGEVELYCHR